MAAQFQLKKDNLSKIQIFNLKIGKHANFASLTKNTNKQLHRPISNQAPLIASWSTPVCKWAADQIINAIADNLIVEPTHQFTNQ